MIAFYYTLLMMLTLPTLVMFIFMATSEKYRKYLFVFIPIVLAVVFKLIYTVDHIKAQPKNSLPKEYTYLYSIEIAHKTIFLWIVEKGKDEPHTVAIPWTAKDSKAAAEARKAVIEGKMIAGKSKEKEKSGIMSDETGELLFYQLQVKDIYKK